MAGSMLLDVIFGSNHNVDTLKQVAPNVRVRRVDETEMDDFFVA